MAYFDELTFLNVYLDIPYWERYDQRWEGLYALHFQMAGDLYFGRDGGPRATFKAPVLFWLDPRHHYQFGAVSGTDRRHVVVFRGRRGQRLVEQGFDPLCRPGIMPLLRGGDLDALFRLLAHQWRAPGPAAHAEAVLSLERILALALDAGPAAGAQGVGPLKVRQAAERIRQEPFRRYDAVSLARQARFSHSHYRRLFRAVIGHPIHEYILRCRMQAAAELLRDPSRPVKEVAALAGYTDAAEFCRAFKARLELSPQHYRRAVSLMNCRFPTAGKLCHPAGAR